MLGAQDVTRGRRDVARSSCCRCLDRARARERGAIYGLLVRSPLVLVAKPSTSRCKATSIDEQKFGNDSEYFLPAWNSVPSGWNGTLWD